MALLLFNAVAYGAVPNAPSSLTAAAASYSRVNLTWRDNSGNEASFRLQRSTDGVNYTRVALLNANVTSYADTSVQPSKKYYYRVRAANSSGYSAWSNTVSVTTPAKSTPTPTPTVTPTATPTPTPIPTPIPTPTPTPTPTPSTTSVTLAWDDLINPAGTTYYLYYSTQPGAVNRYQTAQPSAWRLPETQKTGVVSQLIVGTPYYFAATSITATGESASSVEISYTP